jgi:hypothetical protein
LVARWWRRRQRILVGVGPEVLEVDTPLAVDAEAQLTCLRGLIERWRAVARVGERAADDDDLASAGPASAGSGRSAGLPTPTDNMISFATWLRSWSANSMTM